MTSRLASGVVLRPRVEVDTYSTAKHGDAPLVDAVATFDEGAVFLVNRSITDPVTATVDLSSLGLSSILEAVGLHDDDPDAANTLDDQERVGLSPVEASVVGGGVIVTLPPVSWSALALG